MAQVTRTVLNFRDFGGGEVVTERLYRSAALDRLSDDDLRRFAQLGLGLIVDLRKPGERQAAPSRLPSDYAGTIVQDEVGTAELAPHERYLGGDRFDYDMLHDRMVRWYVDAPFVPEHRAIFRRAIEAIASAKEPVLVHCAAGKDRTGLLVMLIQHLLGVSQTDQLAEYLRTNADAGLADHLNKRLIASAAAMGKTIDAETARGLTGVSAACFVAARNAMIGRYGSIDGYLAAIGVPGETGEQLRARYRRHTETKTSSSSIVTS